MQGLPGNRGTMSAYLLQKLSEPPHEFGSGPRIDDAGEDLHLALYLCYEIHYLGIAGADDRWEWEPSLVRFRRTLERRFEQDLLGLVPLEQAGPVDVEEGLKSIADRNDGPSLSAYLASGATAEQFREFVIHRSLYHLKEADPHSWAIPRLSGRPKAALIEIQADEYGGGREPWMHSSLFRKLMSHMALETSYGHYLDTVPATTLATVNLMSMFGLNRRWRGALAGHLALFEMTSSGPNRDYAKGLRRLGFPDEAAHFYDEHVEADSLHEAIAAHDLAGGLALQEPDLAADILFGAKCLAMLESRFAAHLLSSWNAGSSSLRKPAGELNNFDAEGRPAGRQGSK